MSRQRTNWTPAKDQQLVALLGDNKLTSADIGLLMGTTESAIKTRASKLRQAGGDVPFRNATGKKPGRRMYSGADAAHRPTLKKNQRLCLCCGNPFPSIGAGNRLCGTCKGRNVSPFAI